ncbi:MAG: ArsR family transcriptional regulator [Candidatus Heimdallarchaeota archaeon]|nr:ArsR family transcriptional regulator [Candidatus Heimdallarchaeota archaeon]
MTSEKILATIAGNLDKIADSIMLNSLMEYRKKHEKLIINVMKNDAKKPIYELCNGENKVTEIADILKKANSTVSEHLKGMFDERIVFKNKIGKENFPISIDDLIENIITSRLK